MHHGSAFVARTITPVLTALVVSFQRCIYNTLQPCLVAAAGVYGVARDE